MGDERAAETDTKHPKLHLDFAPIGSSRTNGHHVQIHRTTISFLHDFVAKCARHEWLCFLVAMCRDRCQR